MDTVTILVGNSDNKLTQQEFAHFIQSMKLAVEKHAHMVHFFGGCATFDPWQNVCWVIEIDWEQAKSLRTQIVNLRASYKQDSVAIIVGNTKFT